MQSFLKDAVFRFFSVVAFFASIPAWATVYHFDGRTVTIERNAGERFTALHITSSEGTSLTLDTERPDTLEPLLQYHPMDNDIMILASSEIDELLRLNPEALTAMQNNLIGRGLYPRMITEEIAVLRNTGLLGLRDIQWSPLSQYRISFLDAVNQGRFPRRFTRSTRPLRIQGNALIVTHASRVYDPNLTAHAGINAQISRFRARHLPIVYLVHDDGLRDFTYYMNDRNAATQSLYSPGGEHSLIIDSNVITVTGGYFPQCVYRTLKDAVQNYFSRHQNAFNVHLPMSAIFTGHDQFWVDAPGGGRSSRYHHWNLNEALVSLGQTQFIELVRNTFLVASEANFNDRPFDQTLYTINVFLDHRNVASWGSGSRILNLRFEH